MRMVTVSSDSSFKFFFDVSWCITKQFYSKFDMLYPWAHIFPKCSVSSSMITKLVANSSELPFRDKNFHVSHRYFPQNLICCFWAYKFLQCSLSSSRLLRKLIIVSCNASFNAKFSSYEGDQNVTFGTACPIPAAKTILRGCEQAEEPTKSLKSGYKANASAWNIYCQVISNIIWLAYSKFDLLLLCTCEFPQITVLSSRVLMSLTACSSDSSFIYKKFDVSRSYMA